ncbi:aldose epimerase family protein [Neptunicoccus cionae]|uniref:Aldose 1-epimerase n=1 Tax=Neptunicoccus cionae TaxID=2035344 RepID=A0A916R1R4_9RHOB|nr:aldose epimerase family protein [Amylibacter cionae]GGA27842.1 aldose 1-epimerase [Amylibacter cionae]
MPAAADIRAFTLTGADSAVTVLNLGAVTQSWQTDLCGPSRSIVLGYRDPASYLDNPQFLGGIVGRVANRITGARFELEGQVYQLPANEPPHLLHSGADGLQKRLWQADADGTRAVRLTLRSPDGDQGFPGTVDFETTISLDANTLTYRMNATVDRPTPINLAQHSYYNLSGRGTIWDHHLRINANALLPADPEGIPRGPKLSLDGNTLDFQGGKLVRSADPDKAGIDLNYCVDTSPPQAQLSQGGLTLNLTTDQLGVQLYTGRHLSPLAPPLDGQTHAPYGGLCLEPQGYPNALNQPEYPSIVVTPDRPYAQTLTLSLAPESP